MTCNFRKKKKEGSKTYLFRVNIDTVLSNNFVYGKIGITFLPNSVANYYVQTARGFVI
jgi:hypothetical protein